MLCRPTVRGRSFRLHGFRRHLVSQEDLCGQSYPQTMTTFQADQRREMLEILEVCWVLREELSHFRLTTNHKMKVDIPIRKAETQRRDANLPSQAKKPVSPLLGDLLTSDELMATLLCQEPLAILSSRKVRSLLLSSKLSQRIRM